jgi:hypothetical protein
MDMFNVLVGFIQLTVALVVWAVVGKIMDNGGDYDTQG